MPATVLFREIRERSYAGQISQISQLSPIALFVWCSMCGRGGADWIFSAISPRRA